MIKREELITDLRNKLSPIFNYIAIQRQLDQLNSIDGGFYAGMEMVKLEEIAKAEQIKAEESVSQIKYLLDKLETWE